jgi:2-methylcitrate dehydratase PrpD
MAGATERIATFATGPVTAPEPVRRAVLLSLLDWAACGRAGAAEPVARVARALALDEGGAPRATMLGGGRVPARAAALVNGATSHALDYDDTHFLHIGHPSVVVAAAALAVAEAEGTGGRALLDALLLGLETACRVGDWLGRGHYEIGFHQTGTSGAFGATAAAGRLMGLDAGAMRHALGLAATRAAGLKNQFGTMGKPLNAGFAAEAGVLAAALARGGATSAPDALEGRQGFGPTHAGAAREGAFDGLGEGWVFPAISWKFHACCHGLHASLEALREIRSRGLRPDEVEWVRIATHPRWLDVCNQPAPTTGLGAKFSYRLTAAMALAGLDTAALGTYDDALTRRPDLVTLRDRVVVAADPTLPDTAARVELRTAAGTTLAAAHDIAAPNDLDAAEGRLRAKATSLVGRDAAETLWAALRALEGPGGVAGLARALAGETPVPA